jgi:uncharacterized DUF497 family protein
MRQVQSSVTEHRGKQTMAERKLFDWDAANIAHIADHGVLPNEAEEVISNNPLDIGHQMRNGEERLMQIGTTAGDRILAVITTLRGKKTRVVTAFPANRAYRAFYKAQKEGVEDGKANSS